MRERKEKAGGNWEGFSREMNMKGGKQRNCARARAAQRGIEMYQRRERRRRSKFTSRKGGREKVKRRAPSPSRRGRITSLEH